MRRADHSPRGVLPRVVCPMSEISESRNVRPSPGIESKCPLPPPHTHTHTYTYIYINLLYMHIISSLFLFLLFLTFSFYTSSHSIRLSCLPTVALFLSLPLFFSLLF